jgi:phosphate starvation-inducible protein PhoH
MTKRRSAALLEHSNINPLERQQRRLNRQQRKLEKDMMGITTKFSTENYNKHRSMRFQDIKQLTPLTDTQADFFDSYENNDATGYVLYGSAGTGKTAIALYFALLDVLDENTQYEKIIIVRSVATSRAVGHLPGELDDKTAPFEAPYHSICQELLGRKDAYEKLKDIGKIEFVTTSFLRGSTFNNAIVIFDEAQNTTTTEAKTVISRIGSDAKIIICGDTKQNDLTINRNDVSGFVDILEVTRTMPEVRHFKFTPDDIVRSGFVKSFLIACDRMDI